MYIVRIKKLREALILEPLSELEGFKYLFASSCLYLFDSLLVSFFSNLDTTIAYDLASLISDSSCIKRLNN